MGTLSPVGRIERILLSTDGSEYSEGAVKAAIDAASKCSSHLIAFTMVLSNPEIEAIAPQVVAKGELEAREILDMVESKAEAAGVKIERLVRHGQDPGHQIVNQAEKKNADLIVMGRRGVRGLARMLVGEATIKVSGKARCSVLIVPRAGEIPKKRILVATDGSRYSDAAATMGGRLAKLCDLPVTVVSVVAPDHSEDQRKSATEAVDRVRGFMEQDGITTEGVVIPAEHPEIGIVETARTRDADLIVVGSHGRTGLLEKVMIGSVSERVLGTAECPVMVVKG